MKKRIKQLIQRPLYLHIFLVLGLQLPLGLSAQSLESLLEIARGQNLTLLSMEQEYQAALEMVPQARLFPRTQIDAGAFVLPVQTRVGPQRMRLGVMQPLPWFGTLDAKEQLSLASAKPLSDQVQIEAINIFYQIKLAYYKLYQLEETQQILNRNIALLESLRSLSLSKIEAGKASTADVLRLDIKLSELRKRIEIIDQQLIQPKIDINQLLNRDLNTEIQISESLVFSTFAKKADSLTQQVKDQHPSLRYLTNQQERAQRAIALNEIQGKPSLGLGADYFWVDENPMADIAGNGRDILLLKASLNIPLQRKPYQAKKQEEMLRIEALEQRKEALEDQFLASIQKSWASYEEAQLSYELYQEQVVNTRAVIQVLESNYSNNGSRFDELINLEMDLLNYEIKQLNAVVESHRAKAAIERILR